MVKRFEHFMTKKINKHMKRYTILLDIRDTKIKTTMRRHYILTRMGKMKNTNSG